MAPLPRLGELEEGPLSSWEGPLHVGLEGEAPF